MKKPYYNKLYAEDARALLDALEENGKLIVSAKELGIEVDTLRVRIYNSISYLCEEMDVDEKYTNLQRKLKLTTIRGGVLLEFRTAPKDSLLAASSKPETKSVQNKVIDFLMDARVGDLLDLKELSLSEEQMGTLKDIITQLGPEYLYSILKDRVKIRRVEIGMTDAKVIV